MALKDVLKIKGAKEVLLCFFCYCAIEQTAGLWASSYLNLYKGVPVETAASFGAMFFIGIVILFLPLNAYASLTGLIMIGLGCAPIYPCIIHSTPAHFGEDKSQAVIGVQMAFAYTGTLCMPPLFGIIANTITVALLPVYLIILLVLMVVMHEALCQKTK